MSPRRFNPPATRRVRGGGTLLAEAGTFDVVSSDHETASSPARFASSPICRLATPGAPTPTGEGGRRRTAPALSSRLAEPNRSSGLAALAL
mmetsp:Transcript_93393/g.168718  ORF Transcript_93393/g.168718 Transcript_93393/m.168718 type:complete len:91 (+) Transcript_93393:501-773(+)